MRIANRYFITHLQHKNNVLLRHSAECKYPPTGTPYEDVSIVVERPSTEVIGMRPARFWQVAAKSTGLIDGRYLFKTEFWQQWADEQRDVEEQRQWQR